MLHYCGFKKSNKPAFVISDYLFIVFVLAALLATALRYFA